MIPNLCFIFQYVAFLDDFEIMPTWCKPFAFLIEIGVLFSNLKTLSIYKVLFIKLQKYINGT